MTFVNTAILVYLSLPMADLGAQKHNSVLKTETIQQALPKMFTIHSFLGNTSPDLPLCHSSLFLLLSFPDLVILYMCVFTSSYLVIMLEIFLYSWLLHIFVFQILLTIFFLCLSFVLHFYKISFWILCWFCGCNCFFSPEAASSLS